MIRKHPASQTRARLLWDLTGLAAGLAVLALMLWARQAFQIRTLPERIMESVLLLVPPAQFEGAIERYGPAAKDYALYGAEAGMVVALALIGAAAGLTLRRPAWPLAMGTALYLLAMAVLFPLTGAGFFATELLQNPLLINVVYLGIGLTYASILLLGAALIPLIEEHGPLNPAAPLQTRRALIASVAGTAAAYLATAYLGRDGGQTASSLPLATVPTPTGAGVAPPAQASATASADAATAGAASLNTVAASTSTTVTSAVATTTMAVTSDAARSSSARAAAPVPTATPDDGYPSPPPERGITRDKDGALLAVNRPKGVQQAAVTPNADFYIVTKNAGGDPVLAARDWRLIVDGAVNHPVQLDYPTLRRLPSVSVYKTLECISNLTAKCELTAFGCDLISTAKWTGVRLSDVLALAGGLKPGVVAIAAFGADEYSSGFPAAAVADPDTILAYMMNGDILPREHGFPVRLLVPDHYGYKNTKWLVQIKPMLEPYRDWYAQRNWTPDGVVKTMTRIDVPAPGATIAAGPNRIAGIAYAGARGVGSVEYSADGGKTWRHAALEPALGRDVFIRWSGSFTAPPGAALDLVARAVDGAGKPQIEQFSLPQPNGGSGWNSITVHSR